MRREADPTYVREQYRQADNLNARVQLHARYSVNPYGWYRWLDDQMALPAQGRVLELGCGAGGLWSTNSKRLPPRCWLLLTDLSEGMVRAARANLGQATGRIAYAVADAQTIPCADAMLDVVIANHMLYHVPDRQRALAEIHRVLRPGGKLYATTIGRNHLRELAELLRTLGPEGQAWGTHSPSSFLLEDGAEELAQHFASVCASLYDDALEVTEAEPLVAYVASDAGEGAGSAWLETLRTRLAQVIAERGAFHITKASGLFTAERKA